VHGQYALFRPAYSVTTCLPTFKIIQITERRKIGRLMKNILESLRTQPHFSEGTNRISKSGQPVSWPRFKSGTVRI
jgi:hypothetical protein